MGGLPCGFVTFMFTDIEGSTRLHRALGPAYVDVIRDHNRMVSDAITGHDGVVVNLLGDGAFAAFPRAGHAVAAAAYLQRALAGHPWHDGHRVATRVGIHSGHANAYGGDYISLAVHQAARVSAAAHGGQVLLSKVAAGVVRGAPLRDLGVYRLRDFEAPERLYQLVIEGVRNEFPEPRALPPVRTVPVPRLPMLGRESDVLQARELLAKARLVSVVGAGGVGKTRLLLELATAAETADPGTVWYVDLAALAPGSSIRDSVVDAVLGGNGSVSGDPLRVLCDRLRDVSGLLVLDNCEHVINDAREVVDRLLDAASRLRILTTSRERLGIPGESVLVLHPLALPGSDTDATALADAHAIRLFLDRAESAGVHVDVTPVTAEPIRTIVQQVDGLPLGLELAAARLPTLGLQELANRLADLQAVGERAHGASGGRHRTMDDVVAWSYDLLSTDEQLVFRRLSVFSGGFSVDGVHAVVADTDLDEQRVVAILVALVDRSLVYRMESATSSRFRMLEPIGRYAARRLRDASEEDLAVVLHLRWLITFFERMDGEQRATPDPGAWIAAAIAEIPNFRVGVRHAVDRDYHSALRLAVAAEPVLHASGHGREAVAALTAALEISAPDHPQRSVAELRLAQVMSRSTSVVAPDVAQLVSLVERFAAAGDLENEADARSLLAEVMQWRAQPEAAEEHLHAQIAIANRLDDDAIRVDALWGFGWNELCAGRPESARRHLQDAIALSERRGDTRLTAAVQLSLAHVYVVEGRPHDAMALAVRGLQTCDELGDANVNMGHLRVAEAAYGLDRLDVAIEHTLALWDLMAQRHTYSISSDAAIHAAAVLAQAGAIETAAVLCGRHRAILSTGAFVLNASDWRALYDDAWAAVRTLPLAAAEELLRRGETISDDELAALTREALVAAADALSPLTTEQIVATPSEV
jgi:predicted ATPase/class 3 adenylate cyclase